MPSSLRKPGHSPGRSLDECRYPSKIKAQQERNNQGEVSRSVEWDWLCTGKHPVCAKFVQRHVQGEFFLNYHFSQEYRGPGQKFVVGNLFLFSCSPRMAFAFLVCAFFPSFIFIHQSATLMSLPRKWEPFMVAGMKSRSCKKVVMAWETELNCWYATLTHIFASN